MRLFPCPERAERGTGIIRAMLLGLLLSAASADAQNTAVDPQKPFTRVRKEPVKTEAKVVERGQHHARVEWFLEEEGPDGKIFRQPRGYTKLETGVHYWDAASKTWKETQELIKPSPGGAVADEGPQKVTFSLNVNDGEGSVSIVTPDGQKLRGGVLALAYFDTVTQKQVILALAKDARGRIVGQNQVIYQDAFEGVNADVLYTYTKAGLMQEVIFRTQPPAPDTLELSPESSLLQVLTEWSELPAVKKRSAIALTKENGATLADEKLDFGSVQIGAGKAFWKEEGAPKRETPVGKKLIEENGRKVLFESVPYLQLKESLKDLPDGGWVKVTTPTDNAGRVARRKADTRYAGVGMMASADLLAMNTMKGVSVDWSTVNAATNLVLQGDITYRVQGPVTVKNLTIEGGTVVKFDGATNATITVTDAITTDTADYRPAVLTHLYDGGVGENIASGTPTRNFGLAGALKFDLTYFGAPISLKNLRISWAMTGIAISDGSLNTNETQVLRNIQFVNTGTALDVDNARVKLLNGLVVSDKASGTKAFDVTGGSVRGEQLTLHKLDLLGTNAVEVVNTLAVDFSNNPGTLGSGSQNLWSTSGSSVFTGVVFGNHYLPPSSSYLNAGTTNIDSQLLSSLSRKTVLAPVLYSNHTFSAVTTLGPTVARDVNTPDLGFHYDPLDYAIAKSTVSTNLTFSAGTAVGFFYSAVGSSPSALTLNNRQIVTFNGTAEEKCYFVRTTLSQEGSPGTYSYSSGGLYATGTQGSSDPTLSPHAWATFTVFGGLARYDNPYGEYYGYMTVHLTHCEVWNMTAASYLLSQHLTNCFFGRTYSGQVYGFYGTVFAFQNGTMKGGYLDLFRYGTAAPFTVRDVAFEGTAISQVNGFANANLDYSFNAYTNGASRLTPTNANDRIVTNFNWQAGSLGNYYLPPTSPLIDAGSVTADTVGLYHFSTQTSQAKETNSPVDIGYHYAAMAGSEVGLIGYWKLDGAPNDSSLKGNHGQLVSSPSYTDGVLNSALLFDGSDDFVQVTNSSSLNPTNALSYGCWFKLSSPPTGFADIISKDGESTDRQFLLGVVTNAGVLTVRPAVGLPSGLNSLGGGTAFEAGRWYHVMATYDGSAIRLYVNGVLDGSLSVTGLVTATTQPLRIGGGAPAGQPPCHFPGIIDEVRYYDRALSASDVAMLAGVLPSQLAFGATDLDRDGIPDYLEDRNGNGTFDSGETSFMEADSDFDGISDSEEIVNGTDPLNAASTTPKLLASFRFNSTNWIGDQGQVPIHFQDLTSVAGVEGGGVKVVGPEWTKRIRYRTVEADGRPNMSFKQGTVMFWFKPNWTSTNNGGVGPVPGAWGRLFNLGEWSSDGSYGFWDVGLSPDGDWISMTVHTNNGAMSGADWARVPGGFTSNQWRHVAVTYSATNISIYVDGTNVVNSFYYFNGTTTTYGVGNTLIPPKNIRDTGFFIGTDTAGAQGSQGTFDQLQIFNYPLTAEVIAHDFSAQYNGYFKPLEDTDYDGRSNGDEMTDGTDPLDPLSVIQAKLAAFQFNSIAWNGDAGQMPSSTNGAALVGGVEGNAALVSAGVTEGLAFKDTETNGRPNINLRTGSISLWFNPNWTSSNLEGDGPGAIAPLLMAGYQTSPSTGSFWAVDISADGNGLSFSTKTNGTGTNIISNAAIYWIKDQWHHVVLTYTESKCELFIDGILATTGNGVPFWPDANARESGFIIGGNGEGDTAEGSIDNVETYNYPLTHADVMARYRDFLKDTDVDGQTDFHEIALGSNPQVAAVDDLKDASLNMVIPGVNGVVHAIKAYKTTWNCASSTCCYTLLIVGGEFTKAGGVAAKNIAYWDGTEWHAMGTGVNGPVYAIEAVERYPQDLDPDIFVGGCFDDKGINIAKFKISSGVWTSLGEGCMSVAYEPWISVDTYKVPNLDDGFASVRSIKKNGDHYLVGGRFNKAGNTHTLNVAKWYDTGTALSSYWDIGGSYYLNTYRGPIKMNGVGDASVFVTSFSVGNDILAGLDLVSGIGTSEKKGLYWLQGDLWVAQNRDSIVKSVIGDMQSYGISAGRYDPLSTSPWWNPSTAFYSRSPILQHSSGRLLGELSGDFSSTVPSSGEFWPKSTTAGVTFGKAIAGWKPVGKINAMAAYQGNYFFGGNFDILRGSYKDQPFVEEGQFNNIFRWNTSSKAWSKLAASASTACWGSASGVNGEINAIEIDYNPCSPSTYGVWVGGRFTVAGGVPSTGIARWDGTSGIWSSVGGSSYRPAIVNVYPAWLQQPGNDPVQGRYVELSGCYIGSAVTVSQYKLYVDGVEATIERPPGESSFFWFLDLGVNSHSLTAIPIGNHTLQVMAIDASGKKYLSDPFFYTGL